MQQQQSYLLDENDRCVCNQPTTTPVVNLTEFEDFDDDEPRFVEEDGEILLCCRFCNAPGSKLYRALNGILSRFVYCATSLKNPRSQLLCGT